LVELWLESRFGPSRAAAWSESAELKDEPSSKGVAEIEGVAK